MRRRLVRLLVAGVFCVVVLLAAAAIWTRSQLRASLPVLDGPVAVAGLDGPVSVQRDSLGVPWIRGGSRRDVARATGFVHAQERFFQMDLARRRAAGELAALVGARAVPLDRDIRLHRFRAEARRATELLSPDDRAMLDAYTDGVNAGMTALGARPFEYLVLRQTPAPWRAEDTFLVVLSMFITLQDSEGAYESTLATMNDVLPRELVEFLNPTGTEWDAPIAGAQFAVPPIPGADVYDLRARRRGRQPIELPEPAPQSVDGRLRPPSRRAPDQWDALFSEWERRPLRDGAIGSNNWAVSGRLTADGRPLLANDMHLAIRVPNTWYRAALEWPDSSEPDGRHTVIGVTLPGVPAVVVGSNTHVAWGFTNTYADWGDIVLLEIDSSNPKRYRTSSGWRDFESYEEVIAVAGGPDVHHRVTWTIWGPVMPSDTGSRSPRAFRWVAHDAERLATALMTVDTARTVREVFDRANGRGTPGQNIVAVDTDGHIGWSIFGAVPRRVRLDGRLPASWADGTRGWSGWLDPSEYPRVIDPPSGRIWTANARVVDGDMLAKLGDGSYEVGSRASVIRRRLMERDSFSPRDLLDIQLDASADFLARWRDLLVRTLTPAAVEGHSRRAEVRDVLARNWTGRASPESTAYRLTRAFREEVTRRVIRFVLAECYERDASFDYMNVRRREGPIWKLVNEQPMHLLDPEFTSWNDLLLAALDTVITTTTAGHGGPLRERVWSEYNVAAFQHPLSSGLPFVGRWLDMPVQPLPGDLFTPRMHWGANGASERMVVSPGNEAEGIMQMPTGQSGHPLSPFYGTSHAAWLNGTPTPFLPGPVQYTLTLTP
jgi:penicillin amidase